MVRERAPCNSVHRQFRSRCSTPAQPSKLQYQFFVTYTSATLAATKRSATMSASSPPRIGNWRHGGGGRVPQQPAVAEDIHGALSSRLKWTGIRPARGEQERAVE